MANLLMLPDELKIKIFDNLNGIDKIEILRVCQDFHRIGIDRQILCFLNFSHSYKLSLQTHVKFIARKITCHLVTELNLNGIYWITSAEMRNSLIKFENLTALHVLDTRLSFRDLVTVLNKTEKVRKLALSLKPDNCSDVFILSIGIPITHLFVTYNSRQIRQLLHLLAQFSVLEELWVIEPNYPHSCFSDIIPTFFLNKVVKVEDSKRLIIYQQILSSSFILNGRNIINKLLPHGWDLVLGVCSENINFAVLGNGRIENSLKSPKHSNRQLALIENNLSFYDTQKIKECKNVDNFKIFGLNFHEKIFFNMTAEEKSAFHLFITESSHTVKLRKWCSLSNCFWEEEKRTERTDTDVSLFKKRRVGVNFPKKINENNNKFARFVKHTSEMNDFEIIDTDNNSTRNELWQIESLQFAKNWKILQKLTITSVNIKNAKFLIDITRNCTMLNCLKIHDDVMQDNLSADLCFALQFAQNLKDFRYERKGGIPIDRLFESLKHCTKLERVYIQCRFASKISKAPLETVITRCENLVFLFCYITELPETVCKSIKQSINELGLKPQQIIVIRGQTYTLQNIIYEDIPMYHVLDIVCQKHNFYSDVMKCYF